MKKSIMLLMIVFGGKLAVGQELSKIQPMLDPAASFVALSGYHGAMQLNTLYDVLWPGIPQTSTGLAMSYDTYVPSIKSGLGIGISNDRYSGGVMNTGRLSLRFAPRFSAFDGIVLTGLGYDLHRSYLDWSQITWCDGCQYDLPIGTGDIPREAIIGHRATASLGYKRSRWLAIYQLRYTSQQVFIQGEPDEQWIEHAAVINHSIPFGEKFMVTPGLSYRRFSDFEILRASMNAYLRGFYLGGGYQWSDNVYAQLGYSFKGSVLVSYAFSYPASSLGTQRLVSHSLGVRTTFRKKKAKDVLVEHLWVL